MNQGYTPFPNAKKGPKAPREYIYVSISEKKQTITKYFPLPDDSYLTQELGKINRKHYEKGKESLWSALCIFPDSFLKAVQEKPPH